MRSAQALGSALAVALLLSSFVRPSGAQPTAADRELTVTNRSQHAINELYVSASSNDHWGEDRLGDETLAPGHVAHVKLGRTRDCEFDVQAIYEDASREEAHDVNLCRTRQIAFDGSAATAPPALPMHDLVIANHAARPIQQVLISPGDAGDWGEDRLGDASISVGASAALHYRGDCLADLRVVFDNRSAEERRGVDICAARRVAIQPGWTTADEVPTEAEPGTEAVQLTISNRSGHAAAELYLYPDGSADHGPELLGSDGLEAGAEVAVAFQRPAGKCQFSAHVVYGGKLPDQDLTGLDLCHNPTVVLPGRT